MIGSGSSADAGEIGAKILGSTANATSKATVATAIRTNALSLAHRVIGGLIVNPFEHADQLVRADDYVATIAITVTIV